jgi:hypothetical protein
MRTLGALVIVGLFAVAQGCSSSSGSDTTPTGGSHGGTNATAQGGSGGGTGTTAQGGSGGGIGTGACSLPSCLKSLGTGCVGSGVCATQSDSATGSSNTCYANGIKEIDVHDVETDDRTLTVKNGAATCFSTTFNGNDVYNGAGAITVKNASGDTVASVTIGYEDRLYKVTCTGGQEVSLDQSCSGVWPISGLMGSHCDEGVCAP